MVPPLPLRTGQSSVPKSQALPGNCRLSTCSLSHFRSCYHRLHDHDLTRYSVPPTAPPAPSCLASSRERGVHISWTVTKRREISITSFSDTFVLVLQDCSKASVTRITTTTIMAHRNHQYRGHRYSLSREDRSWSWTLLVKPEDAPRWTLGSAVTEVL